MKMQKKLNIRQYFLILLTITFLSIICGCSVYAYENKETTTSEPEGEEETFIIDGIDFTLYNEGEKPIFYVFDEMKSKFDSLVVIPETIVSYDGKNVHGLLKDGDTYSFPDISYYPFYELYIPKEAVSCTAICNDDAFSFVHLIEDEWNGNVYQYSLVQLHYEIPPGKIKKTTIEVEYKDGTREKITLYFKMNTQGNLSSNDADGTDNPNIIGGVDFTSYNEGKESIYSILYKMRSMNFNHLMIIPEVSNGSYNGVYIQDILTDGDSFTFPNMNYYPGFHLYTPKDAIKFEVVNGDNKVLGFRSFEIPNGDDPIGAGSTFSMAIPQGVVMETSIRVTYKDGTQETITVYLSMER